MASVHTILALSGQPCTGKTTLATQLASHAGGVTIDSDTLAGPLRDAALRALGMGPEGVETPTYINHLRPAVYACLTQTAVHLARQVSLVVVDAPFHPATAGPGFWARFTEDADGVGVRVVRAHLVANETVVRARMADRGEPRDAGKLSNWERFATMWRVPVPEGVLVVDTTNSAPHLLAEDMLAHLDLH